MKRGALIWLSVLLLGGCSGLGFGSLQVESVAIAAQKPSNIAVYLWAANRGEPLTELNASNFRIYEDDQLVDSQHAGLTLLERHFAAEHHTVLLVDMSGDDAQVHAAIARGVAGFVQRVRTSQGVTIYAFDGSEQLQLIEEFERQADASEPKSIPALQKWEPRDTSRDLNTAVLKGLMQLDARLMRVQKAIRIGTLVVFSRGPDLAGRVTDEQLRNALDQTHRQLYALGVGDSTADGLDAIGRSGTTRAQSYATLAAEFENTAAVVDAALRRHYLLSYCSPSRAGLRRLRVEVVISTEDGSEKRGGVEFQFDASGFGPGCDPNTVPRFVLAQLPAAGDPRTPEAPPGVSVDTPTEPASGSSPAPAAGSRPAPPEGNRPTPPPEQPAPKDDDDFEVVPPPDKPGYAPED